MTHSIHCGTFQIKIKVCESCTYIKSIDISLVFTTISIDCYTQCYCSYVSNVPLYQTSRKANKKNIEGVGLWATHIDAIN